MTTKRITCFLFVICISFSGAMTQEKHVEAFSEQIIQQGATGDDVIELQSRLQYLGFYNSRIDGVFGWGTYWALRNFQYEFGMEIDGLGGTKTKQKLEQVTKFNKEEVHKDR